MRFGKFNGWRQIGWVVSKDDFDGSWEVSFYIWKWFIILGSHAAIRPAKPVSQTEIINDCANYLNQKAIDEAIREHNRKLGENLYREGANVCHQCQGHKVWGVLRICYKAKQ